MSYTLKICFQIKHIYTQTYIHKSQIYVYIIVLHIPTHFHKLTHTHLLYRTHITHSHTYRAGFKKRNFCEIATHFGEVIRNCESLFATYSNFCIIYIKCAKKRENFV